MEGKIFVNWGKGDIKKLDSESRMATPFSASISSAGKMAANGVREMVSETLLPWSEAVAG
jgi:hypothetical protein